MGTLMVSVAPGMEVRVEQVRHEFWFGAALGQPDVLVDSIGAENAGGEQAGVPGQL